MSFSVSELNTALGAYKREASTDIFLRQFYSPSERRPGSPMSWTDIVRRNTVLDEQEYGRVEFDIKAMARNAALAVQSSSVLLSGDIRKVRGIKHIANLKTGDLEQTWLADRRNTALTRKYKNMPELADVEFVPWLFDQMISEFMGNFYLETTFKGVYVNNFAYANSWPAAGNGYLKLIADLITATTLTPVVTGAITAANGYDKLELMGTSLPAKLMNKELFLLCSYQVLDYYRYDLSQTFPGQNASVHPTYGVNTLRERPNVMIIPVAEMGTSQRVIITTRNNLELNMDMKTNSGPELIFQPLNTEEIQYRLSMAAGMSISVPKDILVNDQV